VTRSYITDDPDFNFFDMGLLEARDADQNPSFVRLLALHICQHPIVKKSKSVPYYEQMVPCITTSATPGKLKGFHFRFHSS